MADPLGDGGINDQASSRQFICLVAEDEPMVATLLEIELSEAGFHTVASFSRASSALQWLENTRPDVAVIDTMLEDGVASALAATLLEKGVPFIVHSGSDPLAPGTDAAFLAAPWFIKPVMPSLITEEARRLAGR